MGNGRYGARPRDWTPADDHESFGGGGAFPECVRWQFPLGMGREGRRGNDHDVLLQKLQEMRLRQSGSEEVLTLDGLMLDAAAAILMGSLSENNGKMNGEASNDGTQSSEHASAFAFLAECAMSTRCSKDRKAPDADAILATLRYRCADEGMRVRDVDTVDSGGGRLDAEQCITFGQVGRPLVVRGALRDDAETLGVPSIAGEFGDEVVTVNDRAPARSSDSCTSATATTTGVQTSLRVRMRDYRKYMDARRMAPEKVSNVGRPFYLNGWRIFSDHPRLLETFEGPTCMSGLDDTDAILAELGRVITRSDAAAGDWQTIGINLQKLFIGVRGCVTRLHYDAGDAHGWLAQVSGSKLFILFSPLDSKHLGAPSAERSPAVPECDANQAFLDPLLPAKNIMHSDGQPAHPPLPTYSEATMHVAVVSPRDLIIIPKGWWHYALALDDDNVTVMRNFYHAKTNANGLVKMAVDAIAKRKRGAAAKG